jgi:hypothetical protein
VGLKPDTTTKFNVTAATADGRESEHSEWVTVKTLKDTEPPEVPVLKVDKAGTTTIDISWDKVKDNVGVVSYEVYKDNKRYSQLTAGGTEEQLKGLNPETNYTIKLMMQPEIVIRVKKLTLRPYQIQNLQAQ